MRIIFIGAPGTGKGTQATLTANEYNIPNVSAGDILRHTILKNDTFSKKIKNIIDQGQLVDDEFISSLIKQRLEQKDCHTGFLLDGFPRTLSQANFMKQWKIKIDYVIEFTASLQTIIERIKGRRIHLKSGRIYHIKFKPPKIEGIDDFTGQQLDIRTDDTEDNIKKRILEYQKMTIPLIEYYKKEQITGNVNFLTINADNSTLEINKKLKNALNT
ncbi:MAG TPA: adenylate kinase [Buchnera sp. (in: enterobacteria)]|nr:adenylate kinase [Buchnera sp. (in: enterobacteria)]